MKQTFAIMLATLLALSNLLAQKNNVSDVNERNSELVKFVAADFTSCLGTAHSYAQRYVGSRKLKDGSSELFKLIYFSQCRTPTSESFFEVKPTYYEIGVDVILRKPNNEEINYCDAFSNFVKIDASKVNGKRNDETLRFISLEYNASMMFEFQQMKCFILESVISDKKAKLD